MSVSPPGEMGLSKANAVVPSAYALASKPRAKSVCSAGSVIIFVVDVETELPTDPVPKLGAVPVP